LNVFADSAEQTMRTGSLSAVDRWNRFAGIGILLALILYAFRVDGDHVSVSGCLFREWTGWNCLACGLSHSLHAASRLDFAAAVRYHPFGPFIFLAAWISAFYWILEMVLNRKAIVRIAPGVIKGGAAVLALAWLIYWLFHLTPA
jgi:hypothetical protein